MRPRKERRIVHTPPAVLFKPQGVPARRLKTVPLRYEEWEALRLADVERMQQDEAARQMNISRSTFSRMLGQARRFVALALVLGHAIRIGDGSLLPPGGAPGDDANPLK